MRQELHRGGSGRRQSFPFLFGGAFIEAYLNGFFLDGGCSNFPSFSEGLSLRPSGEPTQPYQVKIFPFLFGGAFIEAHVSAP